MTVGSSRPLFASPSQHLLTVDQTAFGFSESLNRQSLFDNGLTDTVETPVSEQNS